MPVVYPIGQNVATPYGTGRCIASGSRTSGGESVVPATLELINWTTADGKHPKLYATDYSWKIEVVVGNDVMCKYGRGRVTAVEKDETTNNLKKITVLLNDWRLANRSRVTAYLQPSEVKYIERKKIGQLKAIEKVEMANEKRQEAKTFIQKKDYKKASEIYLQGLFYVNDITHTEMTDNDERAALLESMIAILNNLSFSFLQDKQYNDCIQNSINAVLLICIIY